MGRQKNMKIWLAYATGPFIKGLEGIPRWGGIHNQSYLQFQIRYRNRFGIVRKREIRAFKCNRFQVFILSGTGDMAKTPQNRPPEVQLTSLKNSKVDNCLI
eukprot:sb/3478452/